MNIKEALKIVEELKPRTRLGEEVISSIKQARDKYIQEIGDVAKKELQRTGNIPVLQDITSKVKRFSETGKHGKDFISDRLIKVKSSGMPYNFGSTTVGDLLNPESLSSNPGLTTGFKEVHDMYPTIPSLLEANQRIKYLRDYYDFLKKQDPKALKGVVRPRYIDYEQLIPGFGGSELGSGKIKIDYSKIIDPLNPNKSYQNYISYLLGEQKKIEQSGTTLLPSIMAEHRLHSIKMNEPFDMYTRSIIKDDRLVKRLTKDQKALLTRNTYQGKGVKEYADKLLGKKEFIDSGWKKGLTPPYIPEIHDYASNLQATLRQTHNLLMYEFLERNNQVFDPAKYQEFVKNYDGDRLIKVFNSRGANIGTYNPGKNGENIRQILMKTTAAAAPVALGASLYNKNNNSNY